MSVQPRLIQTDGYAVLTGVQMLVKAGLETGIDTLVGALLDGPEAYTDLLADHAPLFTDKGLRTLPLPDARQAVTALISAWIDGGHAMGLFDASGVIDAAGTLLSNNLPTGREPGSVLLCFSESDTSNGEAATALLRRAGWFVLEPALQDEVKAFSTAGLIIARASGRPVAMAIPGDLIDGAATVPCRANLYPSMDGETRPATRATENVEPVSAALNEAHQHEINITVNPPGKDEDLPLALVAVGRSYGWTRQAMAELGLVGRIPILRLGVLTPLDPSLITRHTRNCKRVVVIDPTGLGVGEAVKKLIEDDQHHNEKKPAIDEQGNTDPPSRACQCTTEPLSPKAGPAGVIRALRPWLESHPLLPPDLVAAGLTRAYIDATSQSLGPLSGSTSSNTVEDLSGRENPPPGSSLIDLSVVLGGLRRDLSDAQHMLEQHRSGPIDLSVFGERDDASELLLSRWGELDGGLDCDGRWAGAAASGAKAVDGRRSVVLMTSRRFFSLGVSAIADAVRAGRNAVFVIHTEDPAEVLGPRRRWQRKPKVNALDMHAIVQAINAGRRKPTPSVTTIDPSDRRRMARLLERLVLNEGVHVVIARRRRGPRYYRKASEVHRKQSARRGYVAKQGCLVHCTEAGPISARRRIELGVLGVEPTRSGTDPWTVSVSWSWHDETIMHALRDPAIGLAVLERSQPERSRVVPEDLDQLPEPDRPLHADADAWRATLVGLTGTALNLTLDLLLEAGAAMGYLVRSSANAEPTGGPTARRADILFTRRQPSNLPHVPNAPGRASTPMLTAQPLPGHADLLLATELTEAARIMNDPASPSAPTHTHTLVDSLLVPGIDSLATGRMPDTEALIESVQPGALRDPSAVTTMLPIASLAEWLWGHQRYAAWVYLGYLVQRGLVPLTAASIEAAGQRVLGITDPRSSEALRVGRKLAIDPGFAERALKHEAPPLDSLVKTLAEDLAERAAGRRGTTIAGTFQSIVQPLLDQTKQLDDETRRRIVNTAQRCFYWAGFKNGQAYCERFINTLMHVFGIDNAYHDFGLTRAALMGLERAMLIPDEVYLAALLTSPARYRRDRQRLNISLEAGDKISYVHLLRPEFDLFKRRINFTLTLGERALKTVARLHPMRLVRPGWYRTQRDFRDLYLQALVDLQAPQTEAAYRHARDLASAAHTIVGRGDNRRATTITARRRLEKLIVGSDES